MLLDAIPYILYSAVVTACTITLNIKAQSTHCPQSALTCFVRFVTQTAIFSLYYVNWNRACLLCGTRWIFVPSHRGGPDSIQDQSIEICGRQSGTGRGFFLSV